MHGEDDAEPIRPTSFPCNDEILKIFLELKLLRNERLAVITITFQHVGRRKSRNSTIDLEKRMIDSISLDEVSLD